MANIPAEVPICHVKNSNNVFSEEDEYNSQSLYVAYSNTQNLRPHFQHPVVTGRTNDHASHLQPLISLNF